MLHQSALGEEQISREWATIFKQFFRFGVTPLSFEVISTEGREVDCKQWQRER
jgi:hypothetical protein